MLGGEDLAGAGKAGLHLVRDQTDAVLVAEFAQAAHEGDRGLVEPAFALHGLDHDGRDVGRRDVGLHDVVKRVQRLFLGGAVDRDREGAVEDADGGRCARCAVGHRLAGHRDGQLGAAVEGAGEGDHTLPLGVGAGDLHRVFRGFGAGGEEDRLGVGNRRQRVQAFSQFDVIAVAGHLPGDVGEFLKLGGGGGDHLGVAVAGVRHRDARAEVDVAVALDIPDLGVLGAVKEDRRAGDDTARDGLLTTGKKFGIGGHLNFLHGPISPRKRLRPGAGRRRDRGVRCARH